MDVLNDPILKFLNQRVWLEAQCDNCLNVFTVQVNSKDYVKYIDGHELVQNVWPDMVTEGREVIIGHRTGHFICKRCTDRLEREED